MTAPAPSSLCAICGLKLTFEAPPAATTDQSLSGAAGSWLDATGSRRGTDGHFHIPIVRRSPQ